jgi:hypothetical protein
MQAIFFQPNQNKMSYRNPQIIQDRSGEIIPQAIAQASASIAQGINTFGAQRRKEREKRDAENKLLGEKMIQLNNLKAEDAAAFNKGIKGLSKSMQEQMTAANGANSERIYEIKKLQLYGDTNPELSKELATLLGNTTIYNNLAKSMIGSIPILGEMVEDWPKAGRTKFFTKNKNKTTKESEAFVMGIGGAEGYSSGMDFKDGELVAWAKDDQDNYYEINAEDFPSRSQNFVIEAPDGIGDQSASTKKLLYNPEDPEKFLQSITKGEEKKYVLEPGTNDKGQKISYNKQYLNTKEIEGIVTKLATSNVVALRNASDNEQVQQHLLDQFNIDLTPEEFNNLTKNQQQEVANEPTSDLFFDESKIVREKGEDGKFTGKFYKVEDYDEFTVSKDPDPKTPATNLSNLKNNANSIFNATPIKNSDGTKAKRSAVDNLKLALNLGDKIKFEEGGKFYFEQVDEFSPQRELADGTFAPVVKKIQFNLNDQEGINKLVDMVKSKFFSKTNTYEATQYVTSLRKLYQDQVKSNQNPQ